MVEEKMKNKNAQDPDSLLQDAAAALPLPYNRPTDKPGPSASSIPPTYVQETATSSLTPEKMAEAQKLCKYASSALTYEDVPTAIDNLQKALRLLTAGRV